MSNSSMSQPGIVPEENEDRRAAIQARLDAATPGPWTTGGYFVTPGNPVRQNVWGPRQSLDAQSGHILAKACLAADAEFIANAPSDMAYLLSDLATLRARLASSEERVAALEAVIGSLSQATYKALREHCADADLMDGYDWLALVRREVSRVESSRDATGRDGVETTRGNVFEDLGLPDATTRLAKAELARRIRQIVAANGWKQREAADALGLAQSDVSALLRGQLARFSIERLQAMLTRLGVGIVVNYVVEAMDGGCTCYLEAPTVPTYRDRATHLDHCPAKGSGHLVGIRVLSRDATAPET